MYKYSREILEKKYKEVRDTRDILRADNKWLVRERERLMNEIKDIKKELLEYKLLLYEQLVKSKER